MSDYKEMSTVPEHEASLWSAGKLMNRDKPVLWSNKKAPPPIGSTVNVNVNRIGLATVTGYFTLEGWLGLVVKVLDPPAWYVKQNGPDVISHVFGAEVEF